MSESIDRPDPAPLPERNAGIAVVIGASGGIGRALVTRLGTAPFEHVVAFSRDIPPRLDLLAENTIAQAAETLAGTDVRLVIDATGVLTAEGVAPEKTFAQIDPVAMLRLFAVNAIGPALLIKHFVPLFPRRGRAVFATLSAKVGSIGDNRLGGWYGYRASKAALNQIVRTAAIEMRRQRPDALCVALHPGTVDTALSRGFAKTGLDVQSPKQAADNLMRVIAGLGPDDTGGFFDWRGTRLPW